MYKLLHVLLIYCVYVCAYVLTVCMYVLTVCTCIHHTQRTQLVCYCVGFKLSSTKAVNEAAKWKKIRHPNIVSLREMFTTKNFGDNCKSLCNMIVLCVCVCVCST